MRTFARTLGLLALIACMTWTASPASAFGVIPGETGTAFNFTASAQRIDTPDGDKILMWGYGTGSTMQYPGPTLILDQGVEVTINLNNNLSVPTSIVFPGQTGVVATGGTPGLLTSEAAPGGSVSYTFTPTHAGTYMYNSGTQPELQIEMGLVGALIVRPTGFDQATNRTAYGDSDSAYDEEYLFLLSEADPKIHHLIDLGYPDHVDNTTYFPTLWFINGRNAVDTLTWENDPTLPYQPYSSLAVTKPGHKVLLRFIGAGRDAHPMHPHGNHVTIVGRDGRMPESDPGVSGPDLAPVDYTINVRPGATYDAIWDWTGEKLGWDVLGTAADGFPHECNGDFNNPSPGFDATTHEYCPDHEKPMPVSLPSLLDVMQGPFWSGTAFLGQSSNLSPGEGYLGLFGGMFFPWHSHSEKELTNNDIFLGGMLSFVLVVPHDNALVP